MSSVVDTCLGFLGSVNCYPCGILTLGEWVSVLGEASVSASVQAFAKESDSESDSSLLNGSFTEMNSSDHRKQVGLCTSCSSLQNVKEFENVY